jgi:hypothetical protein
MGKSGATAIVFGSGGPLACHSTLIELSFDNLTPLCHSSKDKVYFDDVVDAMVFRARVPPVSVLQFEERKWEG